METCYLIAKKFDSVGCFAIKLERNKALSSLVDYLGRKTIDKGIQILTVSNMEMWGEYKPYHLIDTERDFIYQVLSM